MAPPSNRTGHLIQRLTALVVKRISMKGKTMNKMIITTLALVLSSGSVMAEGLVDGVDITVGAERELEAEVNSVYGSVGMGAITVGATMVDTAADSGKFNISE